MAEYKDAVIIGGGPAGLAAAIALDKLGVHDIVILEREKELGGILRQCIHDGFGLQRFGRSLSGPEYARIFIDEVIERGIRFHTDTAVISLSPDRHVKTVSPSGLAEYDAGAVILAVGCKERSRGSIMIPGERPSGVFTAGSAQAYMNLYNRLPGHEAIILGSGDIGLIMARRLTLEGVHVKAVFEILDHPNGLERNIAQCLDDYGIPLFLNHTVTDIHGNSRLEGVTVCKVDDCLRPVKETAEFHSCDTLILSVGLRPDAALLDGAGIMIDPRTGGAVVDEHFMTSVPGIFTSGNGLHVHDLADFASLESEHLAVSAAEFLKDGLHNEMDVDVCCGKGIGHVVPQKIHSADGFSLSLRASSVMNDAVLRISQSGKDILKKKIRRVRPSEMLMVDIAGGSVSPDGNVEVEFI